MYPGRGAILVAGLLLGACASSAPATDRGTLDLGPEIPDRIPVIEARSAQLVPYPEFDVSWVEIGDAEVYHAGGLFYCYFDGNWFYAHTLGGSWSFVEMSRVPADLFRARGAERPTLVRADAEPARPQPGPSLKR